MKFSVPGPKLPSDRPVMCSVHMYESQFGLQNRLFRALATGSEVFVGPQTAGAMAGLKKALSTPDAIVSVRGPVGVGKTTIVRRALDAIGNNQVIVTVGRMQLGHDEVLELLLEELGVEMPPGTVQRFSAFRRLLLKFAEQDTRVFIVVEDAARIGADALSELEALTASDAGVSEGANIVLMGDSGIDALLQAPQLERIRQRLRLRQEIAPMSANELLGYCRHCFRLAGNEFNAVFENGSAEVLHRLSGGVPRIANNLVESSLISAVENKLDRVNVAQIKLVANEEYGLHINSESEAAIEPATDPVAEIEPETDSEPDIEQMPALKIESQSRPEPEAAAVAPAPSARDNELPELIQDTLPDLEVLAPNLTQPAPPETEPGPDLEATQVDKPKDTVPEWERDPTLAQLRPDLDALELAMAADQSPESDTGTGTLDVAEKPVEAPEPVPEITLDREIQAKIDKVDQHQQDEEARRAEEEAIEEEESGIDDRPTSVILAEARARKAEQASRPDDSIEAQFEHSGLEMPKQSGEPVAPQAEKDPHARTDTFDDLPVLQDGTAPPFEAAANKRDKPPAKDPTSEEPREEIPVLTIESELPDPPELSPDAANEPAPMPEIKLEDGPAPKAEPEPGPEELEKGRKADAELEQIAANLTQARNVDESDDNMAETLFGEDFSMMATEAAANEPPELSADDDVHDDQVAISEAAMPDFNGAGVIHVELETKSYGINSDTSASQRLATVRALNSGALDAQANPIPSPPRSEPSATFDQPQSIEDQINTSMTQTLEAMSVRPPEYALHQDEDEDDVPKRGFFGRFKRS